MQLVIDNTPVMLVVLIASMLLPTSAFAAEPDREYRIKASYLYNLSKFIEWPDDNSSTATAFTFCVYGYNPFADALEKLREHSVKGRAIAIRYVPENHSIDGCQLVFLSHANSAAPKFLSDNNHPAILSVGEDEEFLTNGGIVALSNENNTVLLDINLTRAKQLGFNISANLLEIAHKLQ